MLLALLHLQDANTTEYTNESDHIDIGSTKHIQGREFACELQRIGLSSCFARINTDFNFVPTSYT